MDAAAAATKAVLGAAPTTRPQKKRLLVCCDGTWMNSDKGYKKTGLLNPAIKAQVPSNVTRISRAFKRQCSDGTVQIIEYQSGVGTGSSMSDIVTGGAFGFGIAQNIREVYAFICANYVDGDEIVLIGFSRGAFTARSVAGMIGDLGLLTREGMDHFYPVFKDMENWRTEGYKDPFPNDPFPNKPWGDNAEETYRAMLLQKGYTRVYERSGKLITVKAVAVWDTVGSLGIPRVSWLQKFGIQRSTKEFYDTALSDRIEHAFHALALDEQRPQFSPALWERLPQNKTTTDLRQVWFPGNHGNVGGGWADAGIANMSLAWIMDQLASVGVEFDKGSIERLFATTSQYYRIVAIRGETPSDTLPTPISSSDSKDVSAPAPQQTSALGACLASLKGLAGALQPQRLREWAASPIYQNNHPIRVWGLGAIFAASGPIYALAGKITRTPGLYHKVDPLTGDPTEAFLEDTNERIHPSVRVRLATRGLGLDDRGVWDCPALRKNGWQLRRTKEQFRDPVPPAGAGEGAGEGAAAASPEYRYVWVYTGPEEGAPPQRMLVEETLGKYEQRLLQLSAGMPNVYEFARERCREIVPEV